MSRHISGLAYGGHSLATVQPRYCAYCYMDLRDTRGLPCDSNPHGSTHEVQRVAKPVPTFEVTKSVKPL